MFAQTYFQAFDNCLLWAAVFPSFFTRKIFAFDENKGMHFQLHILCHGRGILSFFWCDFAILADHIVICFMRNIFSFAQTIEKEEGEKEEQAKTTTTH